MSANFEESVHRWITDRMDYGTYLAKELAAERELRKIEEVTRKEAEESRQRVKAELIKLRYERVSLKREIAEREEAIKILASAYKKAESFLTENDLRDVATHLAELRIAVTEVQW